MNQRETDEVARLVRTDVASEALTNAVYATARAAICSDAAALALVLEATSRDAIVNVLTNVASIEVIVTDNDNERAVALVSRDAELEHLASLRASRARKR